MRRYLRTALTALVLATGTTVVLPSVIGPAAVAYGNVTATAPVSIRTGPGLKYPRIGVLRVGQSLKQVGAPKGEWTPVSFQGRTAWIFSIYLHNGTTTPTKVKPGARYVLLDANLRSGPGIGYPVVQKVTKGSKVTLTGQARGEFAEVKINGGTAWIVMRFLAWKMPATPGAAVGALRYTTVATKLWAGSSGNAKLRDLPKGTSVRITGKVVNGRMLVVISGKAGWVTSRFLTAVAPPSASGAPHVPLGSVWDRVAHCESTGNWHINTGNGFYGGLQFTARTWVGFGGRTYAPLAHQATRDEQIAIAKRVLKVQGPGAWPVCSRKAGLTRANGA